MTESIHERRIERLIGRLLQAGVWLSLVLLVAGTLTHFTTHVALAERIQSAGLIVLIATPILRVLVSIFAFAAERDGAFVAITCVVLALLCASFLLGAVG